MSGKPLDTSSAVLHAVSMSNAKRAAATFALTGKAVVSGDYLVREKVSFGSGLKAARELAGLSQREVEAVTGVSNAYVCQLEANKIRRPSLFILSKLAALYGIDREQMFAALPDLPKPLTGEVKAVWKWLPPPRNDEEQIEVANYLKMIRQREDNRVAIASDTNRAGGTPRYLGPKAKRHG